MKKIVILNGSPRKNGHTAALIQAFTEGAQSAGILGRGLTDEARTLGASIKKE